jgi:hypothetical protein
LLDCGEEEKRMSDWKPAEYFIGEHQNIGREDDIFGQYEE